MLVVIAWGLRFLQDSHARVLLRVHPVARIPPGQTQHPSVGGDCCVIRRRKRHGEDDHDGSCGVR